MSKLKPVSITVSPDGFINMLNSQNGGAVVDELNRELLKGVGAVLDHGGKSSITLKINLSKSIGVERGITIDHDVTTKHPKEVRPAKTMFVSSANGLLDAPETQGSFELDESAEDSGSSLSESSSANVSHIGSQAS